MSQTLLFKYINLYMLKPVSLFTSHSLFYILSPIFNLNPENMENSEIRPTFGPQLPKWFNTCNAEHSIM